MVEFIKLGRDDDDGSGKIRRRRRSFFSLRSFFLFLLFFFLISSIISGITFSLSSKIAVVPIKGVIMTEKETTIYGSSVSSRQIAGTLDEIAQDDTIKGVILDINSPGGSPVASEEISMAIKRLSEVKPVYALINDVGASGAFWIAVSTDRIYTSSMSTVGSIGVTSTGLGFEDFIRDYNITYRRQIAGEFKDMGTPFRKPTADEEEIIQEILDEVHVNFINHVANSRDMSYEDVEKYATGEIFLGSKALEIGFVDEIGYYPDVLDEIRNKTTQSAIVVNYGPEPSFMEIIGIEAFSSFFPKAQAGNSVMLQ